MGFTTVLHPDRQTDTTMADSRKQTEQRKTSLSIFVPSFIDQFSEATNCYINLHLISLSLDYLITLYFLL